MYLLERCSLFFSFSRQQEGLLIDCGAIGYCTGNESFNLHDQIASVYGIEPSERVPRENVMMTAGVGQGTKTAVMDATIKGVLATGNIIDSTAATLPNCDVPLLLGELLA